MRHNILVEGFAYNLRPVTMEDAARIVQLRSDPELARYLHSVPPDISRQRAWLETYFSRAGDYYFAVEHRRRGTVEGFSGIYNLEEDPHWAEWGRWVLRSGSLAAVESALLVYRAAFEILGLDGIYCRTAAGNGPVVSFHDSCGLKRSAAPSQDVLLNGVRCELVEHRLARGEWPDVKVRMTPLAERIAGRIRDADA